VADRLDGRSRAVVAGFSAFAFCFPLPYASAAVYACLIGCLFVWLIIMLRIAKAWGWTLPQVSQLPPVDAEPEFGIACYGTLGLLIALRSFLRRSWTLLATDVLAILPGIVVCGLVIRWMISIAGVEFITQENLVSWPTSYFMKTFGKMWLAQTGFTITGDAFQEP